MASIIAKYKDKWTKAWIIANNISDFNSILFDIF